MPRHGLVRDSLDLGARLENGKKYRHPSIFAKSVLSRFLVLGLMILTSRRTRDVEKVGDDGKEVSVRVRVAFPFTASHFCDISDLPLFSGLFGRHL